MALFPPSPRLPRRLGLTAIALIIGGAAAAAEVLYSDAVFELTGDGPRATRACRAVLFPSATLGGDRAPKLALQTYAPPDSDVVTLEIDGAAGYRDPTLVQDNQRKPVVPMVRVKGRALQDSGLMKALRSRKPFFVTARFDGEYVSSRYENYDLDAVMARIDQNCPFSAEDLMADVSARLDAEVALGLNLGDITHIRWVLNRKYAREDDEPRASGAILDEERDYVRRYTADNGLPASKYLTRASARRLLDEKFQPRDPDPKFKAGFQRINDWVFFLNDYGGSRGCAIATRATGSEPSFWWTPYMYFEAYTNSGNGRMAFDMAYPNPFDTRREITGYVDGASFSLRFDGNAVKPSSLRGGADGAMLRAIANGRSIELRGTSKAGGKPLTLKFSASGFNGAFSRVQSNCNRTDLRAWLEPE